MTKVVLKLTEALCVLSLLLLPVLVFGQQNTPEKPKEKTEKTKKKTEKPLVSANVLEAEDLEVDFPEVENWEKGPTQTFPLAELGYAATYTSEKGGRVTVYVYNAGLKEISSDLADARVKAEIEKAKDEIKRVAEAGIYEDLKEVKSGTVNLKGKTGLKSLYSLFNFSARGTKLTSEIYLFTHKNHFIKIRATRPKENGETGDKEVAALLEAIDGLFSN